MSKPKQIHYNNHNLDLEFINSRRNLEIDKDKDINKKFILTVDTPHEVSKSFNVLRQDTGSTVTKIIEHRRQLSDTLNRKGSLQSLKQALEDTIQAHKNTSSKIPSKSQDKKSHRKSTRSLNISKLYDRLNSKCRLNNE